MVPAIKEFINQVGIIIPENNFKKSVNFII